MNKDCELIKDLLPLYVDGICSEESKNLVEKHLETCEDCKKEVDYLRSSLELPIEKNEPQLKHLKKLFNRKVWIRALFIVIVLVILSLVANTYLAMHWSQIWPFTDAEGILENVSVVKIDEKFYIHQEDLFGFGEVVNISSFEESEQGIYKIFLGEQGIHSLPPFTWVRGYMMRDKYTLLVDDESTLQSPVKKIVYCDSKGEEIVTLWEDSQNITEYKEGVENE